ncbi:hypothetical protein BAE44_0009898 [Dichanthelium oligosanthes]|uniref:DUF3741 domain-containing protein n=1 Tax=Dichanthelium oligosanthes TaxID=888268 RepID=A0A1E5VVD7_9POAL|nr:hypothetical protein BAE44_0009898 [Dichanthelium oligosanthes]
MESSAAGGDTPPRRPPRGWLAGLFSGAGRILAAVLGPEPEPSASDSGSVASDAASDGGSPSASCSPAPCRLPGPRGGGHNGGTDNDDSPLFPLRNDQLNQGEKETVVKDYAGSLAIISEIEPKDAIMQLLMQETYSRSECRKFMKIIQERVLDSDSVDIDAGGFALTSAQKAGRQTVDGYSSFSPNESSPATSSLQMHGCDNSAAVGTILKLTHTDQSPSIHNAKNIQPVLKRNYSVREDAYGEIRRVRPKINGNPLNISKLKQVDIIRNHPAANSREELTARSPNASRDEKKLLTDVMGANNLTYPNIISKVESADEILDVPHKPSAVTPQLLNSSFSRVGRDQKGFGGTTLNQCSSEMTLSQDLKKGFPLKVEPLDVFIPFEQQMMDLSHRKHEGMLSSLDILSCLNQLADGPSTTKWLQEPQKKAIQFTKGHANSNRVTCKGSTGKEQRHRSQIGDGLARAKQAGTDGTRSTGAWRCPGEETCWAAKEGEVTSFFLLGSRRGLSYLNANINLWEF